MVGTNDVSGLARSIHQLNTDSELRQQLIIKGRERAKQFNWTDAAASTLTVIKQAVHEYRH